MLIRNLYELKNNLVRDTNSYSVSDSSSDHVVDYPSKAGLWYLSSDAEVKFGPVLWGFV